MRHWIVAAGMIGLVGCATTTPISKKVTHTPRAFIEETAIDVPERIGDAELVDLVREGDVAFGVGARYRLDARPDARLDLFVYPAGRMPSAVALQRGQEAFVGSLEQARAQGMFDALEVRGQENFTFQLESGRAIDSRKTTLSYFAAAGAHESRGYITWRQNYFFKLRLSMPARDAAEIDTLGDRVARELFARAHATSRGACAHVDVVLVDVLPPGQPGMLDPVSEDGVRVVMVKSHASAEFAQVMQLSAQRLIEGGCIGTEALPDPAPGYQRERLPFDANDWSAARKQ